MSSLESRLRQVEFSIVHFTLEFQESVPVSLEKLLRLRRDLRQAGGLVLQDDGRDSDRFRELFDPPLSPDPLGIRRHQKPAPPFALRFSAAAVGDKAPGDTLELSVVFWGDGIQEIVNFTRVLMTLGSSGLYRGEGMFELVSIHGEDAAGFRSELWAEGDPLDSISPVLLDGLWQAGKPLSDLPRLTFITPARLISQGKPLFRANFQSLFPFILRRVTSMSFTHCGVELVEDTGLLLQSVSRIEIGRNDLRWVDWRTFPGKEQDRDIGGVMGSIELRGPSVKEIAWVLQLGSLLNVGKGAAFGAGRYILEA